MVGDLISDVLAGQNAGCRSILLESGQTRPEQVQKLSGRFMTASALATAADLILANHGEADEDSSNWGRGYVGSACLRWLLAHGHDPIAYDNLSEGNTAAIPDSPARLIIGDIADTDHLAEVLRQRNVDAVMHFAALASVPESIADPEAYYRVNVGGTKSVLDAMRAAMYGKFCSAAQRRPTASMRKCRCAKIRRRLLNPYGGTKLAAEWLIKDYARAYGLGYTLLRYFNASGADLDGKFGEDRRHEAHLIPLIFQTAVAAGPR